MSLWCETLLPRKIFLVTEVVEIEMGTYGGCVFCDLQEECCVYFKLGSSLTDDGKGDSGFRDPLEQVEYPTLGVGRRRWLLRFELFVKTVCDSCEELLRVLLAYAQNCG